MNEKAQQPVETGEILPVPSGGNAIEAAAEVSIETIQRRITQFEKYRTLAMKLTQPGDWTDQQGHPYLGGSGAEKVARPFGVCWKILSYKKETSTDDKGPYYFYIYNGVFTLGCDSIEAVGTCSSRDQLFARQKDKDGWHYKALSEVDETNINKAAYTNMVVNGITRILGLRNLTWDQLKAAGIDITKITKIKYAEGGAGGGLVSEAQLTRLMAIAGKAGKKEADVDAYIKAKYSIDSKREIKKVDYEAICTWAESQAAAATSAPAAGPGPSPEASQAAEAASTQPDSQKEAQKAADVAAAPAIPKDPTDAMMKIFVGQALEYMYGKEADKMLKALTSFKGRDGTSVSGVTSVDALGGKRLGVTFDKMKQALAAFISSQQGEANG